MRPYLPTGRGVDWLAGRLCQFLALPLPDAHRRPERGFVQRSVRRPLVNESAGGGAIIVGARRGDAKGRQGSNWLSAELAWRPLLRQSKAL